MYARQIRNDIKQGQQQTTEAQLFVAIHCRVEMSSWQKEYPFHAYMQYLGFQNPSGTQLLSSVWMASQVKSNFCPPYEEPPYKKEGPTPKKEERGHLQELRS